MAIGKSNPSVTLDDILSKTTEVDILAYYLGVTEIPCIIHSPLRIDNNASFGLYSRDGHRIFYIDFATKERGSTFDILSQLWGYNYMETLAKIASDIPKFTTKISTVKQNVNKAPRVSRLNSTELQCKVRDWASYDIEYWKSYGITLEWLKYAEVYPISHKIIIKGGRKYVFGADKYAYAYVEHKDNKTFIKIYQPLNKKGYKWTGNIDRSVWSLWTKIPREADNLIISSSMKDCLNISCNLHIPAICLQGEGYIPKPHVMQDLKNRYKRIIVFYDNDYTNPNNPGRKDSIALASEYNLVRVEIPAEYEAKDPSDLFKKYGKEKYLEIMNNILKDVLWKKSGEK